MDDKVLVLTVSQALLAYVPQTELTDFELIEEPKGQFILFIPEVCMIIGTVDSDKAKIPTLPEFASRQSTDASCGLTFAFVESRTLVSTSIAAACWFEPPL